MNTVFFQSCTFKKFNLRMKSYTETYNDQSRVKHSVVAIAEVIMLSVV